MTPVSPSDISLDSPLSRSVSTLISLKTRYDLRKKRSCHHPSGKGSGTSDDSENLDRKSQ